MCHGFSRSVWISVAGFLITFIFHQPFHANRVFGQLYELETLTRIHFGMTVGTNGALYKYPTVMLGCVSLQELELLETDPKFRELLEFTPAQEQKFKQLYQSYRNTLANEFPGTVFEESRFVQAQTYLRQVQGELNMLISQSQQEQLRAASQRMKLRLFGLQRSLRFANSRIDLAPDARRQLQHVFDEQQSDLQRRLTSFHKSHIQQIVQILDTQQTHDYQQEFRSCAETHLCCVELYALQLSMTEEEAFWKHLRRKSLSSLYIPAAYTFSPSGRMEFNWSENVPPMDILLAKFAILRDAELSARLELSTEQIENLRELANNFQRENQRIMNRRPLQVAKDDQTMAEMRLESEQATQRMDRYTKEVIEPFQRSSEQKITDVLIPRQQTIFNDVILQLEVQRLGLATALNFGELGKRLKISEQQRTWLHKFREQQLKELLDLMRDSEANIWREVRQVFGEEQRQSLDEIIGNEDDGIWPAPSMLLHNPVLDF
jgi:hypothetical protein